VITIIDASFYIRNTKSISQRERNRILGFIFSSLHEDTHYTIIDQSTLKSVRADQAMGVKLAHIIIPPRFICLSSAKSLSKRRKIGHRTKCSQELPRRAWIYQSLLVLDDVISFKLSWTGGSLLPGCCHFVAKPVTSISSTVVCCFGLHLPFIKRKRRVTLQQ